MSYSTGALILTVVICGALSFWIVWLKFTASFSKARFAFFVLAQITSLATLYFTLMNRPIFETVVLYVINFINYVTGYNIVDPKFIDGAATGLLDKALITFLFATALIVILRFANKAIVHWSGPVTDSVSQLADNGNDNKLVLLAMAEANRLLARKPDIELSQSATQWRQHIAPPPTRPEWKDMACASFLAKYREATIEDIGWRDQSQTWVGEIFAQSSMVKSPLVLFLFRREPTDDDILERLLGINNAEESTRWFLIYEVGAVCSGGLKRVLDRDIEIWSQDSLLMHGLHLEHYARDLITQFSRTTVGGTQATLAETFVPIQVVDPSGRRRKFSHIYEEWINEPGRRQLAITGEYGQGKSTAMLEICVKWAERFLKGEAEHERVPLLIELRSKNPAETDPLGFLAQWANRYSLSAQHVMNLIKAGRAVVIFEGFDELRNAGRMYERHEHFNTLWGFAYPGVKLIFTGRPNFFLDEKEKNSTLRADPAEGAGSNAYTEILRICMFKLSSIAAACRAYSPSTREGIIRTSKSHKEFREIVARPSMLPVAATIWPNIEKLESSGVELSNANLLEEYLSAVYTRKEAEVDKDRYLLNSPPGANYLLLPRSMKEILTLRVVWQMAVVDAKNTITRDSFNQAIADCIDDVMHALQSREIPQPVVVEIRVLEARLKSEQRLEWLERLCTDVASAGLFVEDPAGGPSNLRFPHKQYFEYLVAKIVWFHLFYPKNPIVRAITQSAKIDDISAIVAGTQSYRHLNELLDRDLSCFRRDHAKIIAFLLLYRFQSKLATFMRWYSGVLDRLFEFLKGVLRGRKPQVPSDEDRDSTIIISDFGRFRIPIISDLIANTNSPLVPILIVCLPFTFLFGMVGLQYKTFSGFLAGFALGALTALVAFWCSKILSKGNARLYTRICVMRGVRELGGTRPILTEPFQSVEFFNNMVAEQCARNLKFIYTPSKSENEPTLAKNIIMPITWRVAQ